MPWAKFKAFIAHLPQRLNEDERPPAYLTDIEANRCDIFIWKVIQHPEFPTVDFGDIAAYPTKMSKDEFWKKVPKDVKEQAKMVASVLRFTRRVTPSAPSSPPHSTMWRANDPNRVVIANPGEIGGLDGRNMRDRRASVPSSLVAPSPPPLQFVHHTFSLDEDVPPVRTRVSKASKHKRSVRQPARKRYMDLNQPSKMRATEKARKSKERVGSCVSTSNTVAHSNSQSYSPSDRGLVFPGDSGVDALPLSNSPRNGPCSVVPEWAWHDRISPANDPSFGALTANPGPGSAGAGALTAAASASANAGAAQSDSDVTDEVEQWFDCADAIWDVLLSSTLAGHDGTIPPSIARDTNVDEYLPLGNISGTDIQRSTESQAASTSSNPREIVYNDVTSHYPTSLFHPYGEIPTPAVADVHGNLQDTTPAQVSQFPGLLQDLDHSPPFPQYPTPTYHPTASVGMMATPMDFSLGGTFNGTSVLFPSSESEYQGIIDNGVYPVLDQSLHRGRPFIESTSSETPSISTERLYSDIQRTLLAPGYGEAPPPNLSFTNKEESFVNSWTFPSENGINFGSALPMQINGFSATYNDQYHQPPATFFSATPHYPHADPGTTNTQVIFTGEMIGNDSTSTMLGDYRPAAHSPGSWTTSTTTTSTSWATATPGSTLSSNFSFSTGPPSDTSHFSPAPAITPPPPAWSSSASPSPYYTGDFAVYSALSGFDESVGAAGSEAFPGGGERFYHPGSFAPANLYA